MRIVIQGSLTPKQLGEAVKEIVADTLKKLDVEAGRHVIHNPIVEFTLNIKGMEQPQLIVNNDSGSMLVVYTGYENGEFKEYVPMDKEELLNKFERLVEEAEKTVH